LSKAALRDSAFELSGEILAEFRAQPGQKAAIFEAIGDEFNSVQIHLPIANFFLESAALLGRQSEIQPEPVRQAADRQLRTDKCRPDSTAFRGLQ